MRKPLKFLSFWSINDALDVQALTEQLDELKASGLEGVIFHPRYYPNEPKYMSPAYLDIVSDIILYAKQIEMAFWLYDENGWPSGTAGGEVMAVRPELTCKWLAYEEQPDGEFGITVRSKPGVSSFQSEATALFIEITHETYRKGLKPEAFEYVTGFFSDEVGFLDGHGVTLGEGGIPWDERFPLLYEQRYSEPLAPRLPMLFLDGAGHEQVRARYWEMLTDALIEGFYQPIAAWCKANGKRYTAHLKAEEHPYFQLTFSGSCFQVLKGIETPAIDALERNPGNPFYPRMLHSIAAQQGRDGCLVEAMGGSGWGVTPESFTAYILWLAGHGIDQFVLHLNQFKLKTQAIQDWPPSMPCHLSWKEAFPALLSSIQQKAAELADLSGSPEVLIVVPTRGIMARFQPEEAGQLNVHDGSGVPDTPSGRLNHKLLQWIEACYAAGIHYELTEERAVEEEGRMLSGELAIGHRRYRKVIIAEGCLWNDDGIVERMKAAGIQVEDAASRLLPRSDAPSMRPGPTASCAKFEVPEQGPWHAQLPDTNQVGIAFRPLADRELYAEIPLEGTDSFRDLSIYLHDDVDELTVNGNRLPVRNTKSGYEAVIPDNCLRNGGDRIRITCRTSSDGEPLPVGFLRGRFSVVSLTPYADKDGAQWMTEGGFKLTPMRQPAVEDLVASGFPFSGLPVLARKELHIPRELHPASRLQLTGVHAAAAHVRIGNEVSAWCWGPDWSVDIGSLPKGRHELTVALYPSTYNAYGPHRHVDGDRHLTSPDQYKGVKNFADSVSAPEHTLGKHWHFVKWGLCGEVRLQIP